MQASSNCRLGRENIRAEDRTSLLNICSSRSGAFFRAKKTYSKVNTFAVTLRSGESRMRHISASAGCTYQIPFFFKLKNGELRTKVADGVGSAYQIPFFFKLKNGELRIKVADGVGSACRVI